MKTRSRFYKFADRDQLPIYLAAGRMAQEPIRQMVKVKKHVY